MRKIIKLFYKKLSGILKTKKAVLIFVIAVIGIFIATRGSADLSQIKTVPVQESSIKSNIIATGKVKALDESTVHFAVSGKVVWVGVKEGDYVKKWQAIASLDKEKYEIALRQTNQDVVAADAELAKVYDDISKASGAESFDNRIKRTAAEATKNKAYDEWLEAKRNLKDAVLLSPISGTVLDLDVLPGEEILATTAIAKIGDNKNLVFAAEVDETDISRVNEDQKTQIILDAFPEKTIDSEVKSIANQGTVTSTESTVFEVKFSLDPPEIIRLGMNGEADITIQSLDNVIVVPIEAVVDENQVWIKADGGYQKKDVDLGIESDLDVQIISGLETGQEVVITGFDQINKKSLIQKIIGIFSR